MVSLGSLLAGSEPQLSPGAEAVVSVGVATLWSDPAAVRPIDQAAVWVPARPRDWVEAMSAQERAELTGRALAQLLLGDHVLVLELAGEWARVAALGQRSTRDPRGYPGWVPADQLSSTEGIHAAGVRVAARHRQAEGETEDDRSGVWHVVTATATALRDDPDAALAVPGVTFGTRLLALGAPFDGWLPVAVPGRFEPAWAIEDDVAPLPPAGVTPDPDEVIAWADRLRDVPYLPGGNCAYGVDAAGLIHLVWRRFGLSLPRDLVELPGATSALPLGAERPGDLYFFAGPSGVTHVGFVAASETGGRAILHADPVQGRVVLEEIAGERAVTLAGAARVTG